MSAWKKKNRNHKNDKRGLSALVQEELWELTAGDGPWSQADDVEVNGTFVPGFSEAFICSAPVEGHHMKRVAEIMLIYKWFLACRLQHISKTRTTGVQDGKDVACCN